MAGASLDLYDIEELLSEDERIVRDTVAWMRRHRRELERIFR